MRLLEADPKVGGVAVPDQQIVGLRLRSPEAGRAIEILIGVAGGDEAAPFAERVVRGIFDEAGDAHRFRREAVRQAASRKEDG